MLKRLCYLIFLALSLQSAFSQSPDKTDYARAVSFLWENVNNKKAFNLNVVPTWLPDSSGFWFAHYAKGEKFFYKIVFKPLQKSPLFDHDRLATQLEAVQKRKIDSKNLELENLKYVDGTLLVAAKRALTA